jgi:hypothetical protein
MTYRYFTKTDGLKVYIRPEDIIAYEEEDDHVLIITVIGDFEVVDSIEEIFGTAKQDFSNN